MSAKYVESLHTKAVRSGKRAIMVIRFTNGIECTVEVRRWR